MVAWTQTGSVLDAEPEAGADLSRNDVMSVQKFGGTTNYALIAGKSANHLRPLRVKPGGNGLGGLLARAVTLHRLRLFGFCLGLRGLRPTFKGLSYC